MMSRKRSRVVPFTASEHADASTDDDKDKDKDKDDCFHPASDSRSESAVSNDEQSDEDSISIGHQKYPVIGAVTNSASMSSTRVFRSVQALTSRNKATGIT